MTLIERLRNTDKVDDFARLDAADALEHIQTELNRPGSRDAHLRRVCRLALRLGNTDSSSEDKKP